MALTEKFGTPSIIVLNCMAFDESLLIPVAKVKNDLQGNYARFRWCFFGLVAIHARDRYSHFLV